MAIQGVRISFFSPDSVRYGPVRCSSLALPTPGLNFGGGKAKSLPNFARNFAKGIIVNTTLFRKEFRESPACPNTQRVDGEHQNLIGCSGTHGSGHGARACSAGSESKKPTESLASLSARARALSLMFFRGVSTYLEILVCTRDSRLKGNGLTNPRKSA